MNFSQWLIEQELNESPPKSGRLWVPAIGLAAAGMASGLFNKGTTEENPINPTHPYAQMQKSNEELMIDTHLQYAEKELKDRKVADAIHSLILISTDKSHWTADQITKFYTLKNAIMKHEDYQSAIKEVEDKIRNKEILDVSEPLFHEIKDKKLQRRDTRTYTT